MPNQNRTYKLSQALEKAVDGIDDRLSKKKQKISGLSTGYIDLDEFISGFEPGQLIALGARPCMGSSLLAENIATKISIDGYGVGLFTMGFTGVRVAESMMCSISRVNRLRLRSGCLYNDEWAKLTSGISILNNAPIAISDRTRPTLQNIFSEVISMSKIIDMPLSLVVIDDLNKIHPEGKQQDWSRKRFMDYLLKELKKFAVDKNIIILAVVGLKRRVEKRKNKMPFLFDLKQGKSFEKYVDIILFLYRQSVYEPINDDIAQIIVAHQNYGSVGIFRLRFLDEFGVFENAPTACLTNENQFELL